MRRVILIVGPPGSGKTTHAMATGLRHLEREQFPTDHAFRAAATRAANKPGAQLAIIRCCPTLTEQAEWVAMIGATEVHVMPTDQDECIRRCRRRGRSRWRGEVAAVERWFASRGTAVREQVTSRQWW